MRRTVLIVLVLCVSSMLAAAPATRPAEAPKPPAPSTLKVKVVSVEGPANKLRIGQGEKTWEALKAGEELSELTVIRTGFGAKVVLEFEDRGRVTVNNATKVGLGQLRKEGDRSTARLGLKYGTLRAKVEGRQGRNDFRISTPVATLSVRGSEADVGALGDSDNVVDPASGTWRQSQQQAMPDGSQQTTQQQDVEGGETGNAAMDPPIQILTVQWTLPLWDAFGTTGSEQGSMTSNNTGRRAGNTPAGVGAGSMDTSTTPVVSPGTDEPGYP